MREMGERGRMEEEVMGEVVMGERERVVVVEVVMEGDVGGRFSCMTCILHI